MFDTLGDVRGSWFWGHTTAALRGLTCFARPQRCGRRQAGHDGLFSGAVATLPASGADSRIKAAVPLSGVLAWDEAVRSPQAWQHALLSQPDLAARRTSGITLQRDLIAPTAALAGTERGPAPRQRQQRRVLSAQCTWRPWRVAHRQPRAQQPIANFDHGCYKLTGGESASTIEARATLHAEGGQRAFFRHHPLADPAYPSIPNPPTVGAGALGSTTYVTARVDRPAGLQPSTRFACGGAATAPSCSPACRCPTGGGLYDGLVPAAVQRHRLLRRCAVPNRRPICAALCRIVGTRSWEAASCRAFAPSTPAL